MVWISIVEGIMRGSPCSFRPVACKSSEQYHAQAQSGYHGAEDRIELRYQLMNVPRKVCQCRLRHASQRIVAVPTTFTPLLPPSSLQYFVSVRFDCHWMYFGLDETSGICASFSWLLQPSHHKIPLLKDTWLLLVRFNLAKIGRMHSQSSI